MTEFKVGDKVMGFDWNRRFPFAGEITKILKREIGQFNDFEIKLIGIRPPSSFRQDGIWWTKKNWCIPYNRSRWEYILDVWKKYLTTTKLAEKELENIMSSIRNWG